jgi:hypothetical protein
MDMEMEDNLTAFFLRVDYRPESFFGNAFQPRDLLHGVKKVFENISITTTWAGATGWISSNASTSSLSYTLLLGISPAAILQKMQSFMMVAP